MQKLKAQRELNKTYQTEQLKSIQDQIDEIRNSVKDKQLASQTVNWGKKHLENNT